MRWSMSCSKSASSPIEGNTSEYVRFEINTHLDGTVQFSLSLQWFRSRC